MTMSLSALGGCRVIRCPSSSAIKPGFATNIATTHCVLNVSTVWFTPSSMRRKGFRIASPAHWEVTHPRLALVRLHGRNAATWNSKSAVASDRFNYDYSDSELAELAESTSFPVAGPGSCGLQ